MIQSSTKANGAGACFNCKKDGHWFRDCPLKSSNKFNRSPNSHLSSTPEYPAHHCRCGAGLCEIRVSQSQDNRGRYYYRCPGKFEMDCKYFKWCNQLKIDQVLKVKPKPFPICGICGAGVCSVKVEENEPNVGRRYFACPIKQGYGMCSFRQWVDIYVGEPSMEDDQEMLSYEAEMQIKAVEMMFSPEPSLKKAKIQVVNNVDESFDVELGLSAGDPEVHLSTVIMEEYKQENFKASTVIAPLEHPNSEDVINLPDDKLPMTDSLNLEDLPQSEQMLRNRQNEDSFTTPSIVEAFEKLFHCLEKNSDNLDSVGPNNFENVMKERGFFAALELLHVDCNIILGQVIECIKQETILSNTIEQVIKDDPSARELLERYKSKRNHFEKTFHQFCEAGKVYMASNERLISLREKTSCVRGILAELEEELSCCEVANGDHKESLLQIAKTMSDCKESMEATYEETGDILKAQAIQKAQVP